MEKSMGGNEMTVKRKGGCSEVRRKTGSIRKVRWEVKDKSETKLDDRKLMCDKGGERKTETEFHRTALRLAGCCKKLSWCYTNLSVVILESDLACCVYDVDVLFKLLFITLLLLLPFIALDAAVTSFPQRTNTLFFFFEAK